MITINAPWTDEQVRALNAFQERGRFHPFTCGAEHHRSSPVLTATPDGWRCPDPECSYTQDWALQAMIDMGLGMTEVKPSCGTTQHCAVHGFCHRCDPALSDAALLIVRALRNAGVPDAEQGAAYREMVATLRHETLALRQAARRTSPKKTS